MSMLENLSLMLGSINRRSRALKRIADAGTEVRSFTRVHGWLGSRKYRYGKSPELYEAQLSGAAFQQEPKRVEVRHASEKVNWRTALGFASSSHFAKCEEGIEGGDRVWKLCRLLKNPKRLELLVRLYRDYKNPQEDGYNVTIAEDKSELGMSATSEYLQDLANMGLIRRKRGGRIVVYYPDFENAKPAIRMFATALRNRLQSGSSDLSFQHVFPALSNAFRARVVKYLSDETSASKKEICERYDKSIKNIDRDMKLAVDNELVALDSEDDDGVYRYWPPYDPIAQMLVDLVGHSCSLTFREM